MGIIRILFIIGGLVLLYMVIKRLLNPPDFVKCGRCEGNGFWYGARGRETCDWCRGSGKLPRESKKLK